GVCDARSSFVASSCQGGGSTLFSLLHQHLALVGRSQTIRNTLGTLIQRWEHELHREPDEHREGDHLTDERHIDVHTLLLKSFPSWSVNYCAAAAARAVRNGLLKVNSRATPTPIIEIASSRPAITNSLVCSCGISSGCRAEASRNLPPNRPKP